MDAASLYGSGVAQYINEEFEEAIKHFTCAITFQDCADYRTARAAAFLKLGKLSQSLQDAAAALSFEPKAHMALHWRGIALFYMGDFVNAKAAFEESLRANASAKAPRALWLRKCDAELSGSTLPLGGIVAEASKATGGASAYPASTPVATAVPVAPAAASSAPAASSAAAPTDSTISGRKPIRREWYQNDTTVSITLFAKDVPVDACKVEFQEQELSMIFPLPGFAGEDYQLDLDLFDAIDPAASTVEVSKMKVELSLAKRNHGTKWGDLEKMEMESYVPEQPAYPTSNKAKRDWSQIDREMEQEIKGEKPAGDEALNTLFKQIYDRADDETRRAMNKSFQTSGGTVLSTNWGEVARADYEGKDRPSAPDGQEWRDSTKK